MVQFLWDVLIVHFYFVTLDGGNEKYIIYNPDDGGAVFYCKKRYVC